MKLRITLSITREVDSDSDDWSSTDEYADTVLEDLFLFIDNPDCQTVVTVSEVGASPARSLVKTSGG